MSLPIEDYALIGDTRTAALVGRNGSVDWLCLPRFDSAACFASLLGDPSHGHWSIAPEGAVTGTRRRYRDGTLVLETEFTTASGVVRVVDCMPPGESIPNLLRLVEGVSGRVRMRMEMIIRFDYGWIVPWVRKLDRALVATGGPDAIAVRTPVVMRGEGLSTVAEFTVGAGERMPFVLSWFPSHDALPPALDCASAVEDAEQWWRTWSARCSYEGPWRDAVVGSLVALKALTYLPTGGIIAAATTSLPEELGGVRNWDYRYCWLRDSTFTLIALLRGGHRQEACAWRDWLLRAVAGAPAQLQIMYGLAGERRLSELTLDWLPGYASSKPVRIGNAAVDQLQLDVYGEVSDTLFQARKAGIDAEPAARAIQRQMLDFLASAWREPDEGIWEVRGPRRHFTPSQRMTWVAFDRAVKAVEGFHLEGPVERWRRVRDEIHADVCAHGFDRDKGGLHAELWRDLSRREPALDAPRGIPAREGRASARHRPGDRARATRRWAGQAVPDIAGGRRATAGRGYVPRLQLLAGRQLRARGSFRGSAGSFRAPLVAAQRRRAARGGIRSHRAPPARQLSPSLLARRPGEYRVQPCPARGPMRARSRPDGMTVA